MTPPAPVAQLRRIGFLGPRGTFTQMALDNWVARHSEVEVDALPFQSVTAALSALRAGDLDGAMVPIENSVEGGVSATLDALVAGDPLVVVGETHVPITFVACARPGMTLEDVRTIGTHSVAWAQIRGWVDTHAPKADYIPTSSTAASAMALARPGAAPFDLAVCAPVAATNEGLEVLAENIEDNAAAVTRFVMVCRPGTLPERTGADKTTLVLYQRDDHSGGLLELLEQFAVRGINLSRLESRPTGEAMGRYCFSIDCEGHVLDERVGEALKGLRRVCADVRFLGSYPRADGVSVQVGSATTDAAFADAADWLGALRGGR